MAVLSIWWWFQPRIVHVPGGESSFEYVVRHTGTANPDGNLPMVIALHGNGDSPENFFDTALGEFDEPARVILLKGPRTMGMGGAAWPTGARELRRCGDDVAGAARVLTREFETEGAPILVGFSGGAAVVYYLAAVYPDEFGYALPVAGLLPEDAVEGADPMRRASIAVRGFHGSADQVVGVGAGRQATALLRSRGIDASLTELAGDHHVIFLAGNAALLESLAAAVREAGAGGP